jgi:hypothetical protein
LPPAAPRPAGAPPAGADIQVIAHVSISELRQMRGAADLEDAWLRARLGHLISARTPADLGPWMKALLRALGG